MKSAMVASARRRVVLADSSKIGTRHLVTFATLADIDVLVTDAELPSTLLSRLVDTGIEVITA